MRNGANGEHVEHIICNVNFIKTSTGYTSVRSGAV